MTFQNRLVVFALLVAPVPLLLMGLLVGGLAQRRLADAEEKWGEEWETQRRTALITAWLADMEALQGRLGNLVNFLCVDLAPQWVAERNWESLRNSMRNEMTFPSDGVVSFVLHNDTLVVADNDNRLGQLDSVLTAVVEQERIGPSDAAEDVSGCPSDERAASPVPVISSSLGADTVWMSRRLTVGNLAVFAVVGKELVALEAVAGAVGDDLLLAEGPERAAAREPWVLLAPEGASRGDGVTRDLHEIATIRWLRPELGEGAVRGVLSVGLARPFIDVTGLWYIGILCALVVSVLLTFLLARHFAAGIAIPIKRMADTAMIVGLGNPDRGFRYVGRSLELRRMALSLNRMVARMRADMQTRIRKEREVELGLANRGLSHDMSSSVGFIHQVADLLEDAHDKDPNELVDRYTRFRKHLRIGIDKMMGLADLLGRESLRATEDPTDLAAVVRREVEMQTGHDHISITVSKALGSELKWVKMDEPSLQRVVQNLIENAVTALRGEGGNIRIGCEEAALKGAAAHRLVIEDDGPGISNRDRYRIFDAGFSTRGKGKGLGLSIVRWLVGDVGGRIQVGSGKEGGTRVEVRLKAVDPGVVPCA